MIGVAAMTVDETGQTLVLQQAVDGHCGRGGLGKAALLSAGREFVEVTNGRLA